MLVELVTLAALALALFLAWTLKEEVCFMGHG